MKNKYILGEVVEDRSSNMWGTIKDFEVFDDMVLYYFKEGGALPEHRLRLKGTTGLSNFLNKTNEEKNKIWETIFRHHNL